MAVDGGTTPIKYFLSNDGDVESPRFYGSSDPDGLDKGKDYYDSDEHFQGRRPSRIAPVRSGSVAESRVSVGKQLELEADNAIKYRTCSWQKVRRVSESPGFNPSHRKGGFPLRPHAIHYQIRR